MLGHKCKWGVLGIGQHSTVHCEVQGRAAYRCRSVVCRVSHPLQHTPPTNSSSSSLQVFRNYHPKVNPYLPRREAGAKHNRCVRCL